MIKSSYSLKLQLHYYDWKKNKEIWSADRIVISDALLYINVVWWQTNWIVVNAQNNAPCEYFIIVILLYISSTNILPVKEWFSHSICYWSIFCCVILKFSYNFFLQPNCVFCDIMYITSCNSQFGRKSIKNNKLNAEIIFFRAKCSFSFSWNTPIWNRKKLNQKIARV